MMGGVSDQLKELQDEVDKWKEVADKWHEEAVGNFNDSELWKAKAESRKLSRDAEIQMRKDLREQLDDLKLKHGKLRDMFDSDGRALIRYANLAYYLEQDLIDTYEKLVQTQVHFNGLAGFVGNDIYEETAAEARRHLAAKDEIDPEWRTRIVREDKDVMKLKNREDDAPVLLQFESMKTVLKEAVALADQGDAFDLDWRHECLNLALRAHLALNHESLTWTQEEIDTINKEAEELGKVLNWREDDDGNDAEHGADKQRADQDADGGGDGR